MLSEASMSPPERSSRTSSRGLRRLRFLEGGGHGAEEDCIVAERLPFEAVGG